MSYFGATGTPVLDFWIYGIVGEVAKFRSQCLKYKMDFYPELVVCNFAVFTPHFLSHLKNN